jgi:hypothetical protein
MAFAQLTYRESLRDIESCLRALPSKLYHMGFRAPRCVPAAHHRTMSNLEVHTTVRLKFREAILTH